MTAPVRTGPEFIRGRGKQLDELAALIRKPGGQVVVLAGMGGVGKSTLAAAVADRVGSEPGRRVWWVSAADAGSLISGMSSLAAELGASLAEQEAAASGSAQAPDVMWTVLDRQPDAWLLVIDNADVPDVLVAQAAGDRASTPIIDGTGWLRIPKSGAVVVTTRTRAASVWGRDACVREVERVDGEAARQILLDLAPAGGSESDAGQLGERLGGLPLALHLAGSYLGSEFASIRTFAGFRAAMEESPRTVDLLSPDPDVRGSVRMDITRTWELSLDALERHGIPQSRTLLRLLSCMAPLAPLPEGTLGIDALAALMPEHASSSVARTAWVEQGMRALVRVGLVNRGGLDAEHSVGMLFLHPVVADTGRAQLEASAEDGDPYVQKIRSAAARIVSDALLAANPEQSENWPRLRGLAPHLRALFTTVAPHADETTLAGLCDAAANLAYYFEWIGPSEFAEDICRVALSTCGLSSTARPALNLRYWLGRSLSLQGRWSESEQELAAVRAEHEEMYGPDAQETLRTRRELARILAEQGHYAQAEFELQEVATGQQRSLGPEHPDTLNTQHTLGWVLARGQRWPDAEPMFRLAAQGRARVFGKQHPYTLASRNRLAWTLGEQGRLAEAEAEFGEILSIRKGIFGNEHHATLATRQRLAWILALQGQLAAAEAELTEVVGTQTRLHGAEYPSTIDSTILLGRVIAESGRPGDARVLLESALDRQIRLQGPDHPQTQQTRKLIENLTG
jgi:hypothetical protein